MQSRQRSAFTLHRLALAAITLILCATFFGESSTKRGDAAACRAISRRGNGAVTCSKRPTPAVSMALQGPGASPGQMSLPPEERDVASDDDLTADATTHDAIAPEDAPHSDNAKRYKAYLATGWFGEQGHHWATGKEVTCPSGCTITFANRANAGAMKPEDADLLLFHAQDSDWIRAEALLQAPRRDGQLRAVMAAEAIKSFHGVLFNETALSAVDVDVSYRPQSFFRDFQYPLEAITRWSSAVSTATMESTWDDVTEGSPELTLVEPRRRHGLDDGSITFASGYCGSVSGREDYVLELLRHVPVEVYGNAPCMKHASAPPERLAMDRQDQWLLWKQYKFHLAFENFRAPGYHTEKLFLTFLRGQIPIVLGGSDVADHAPSKDSYIDTRDYPSPAALAARLREIDSDDDEFQKFFEWRARPFSSYGRFFREAIEAALPVAKAKGDWSPSPMYFTCGLCSAISRWDAEGRPMPDEPVAVFENEGRVRIFEAG